MSQFNKPQTHKLSLQPLFQEEWNVCFASTPMNEPPGFVTSFFTAGVVPFFALGLNLVLQYEDRDLDTSHKGFSTASLFAV